MGLLSCCSAVPITKGDEVFADPIKKSKENGHSPSHKVCGLRSTPLGGLVDRVPAIQCMGSHF